MAGGGPRPSARRDRRRRCTSASARRPTRRRRSAPPSARWSAAATPAPTSAAGWCAGDIRGEAVEAALERADRARPARRRRLRAHYVADPRARAGAGPPGCSGTSVAMGVARGDDRPGPRASTGREGTDDRPCRRALAARARGAARRPGAAGHSAAGSWPISPAAGSPAASRMTAVASALDGLSRAERRLRGGAVLPRGGVYSAACNPPTSAASSSTISPTGGTARCPLRRSCPPTIRPCCSPTPAWCSSSASSRARSSRDYARATTCQKCVRAGGKHNDLEQVGHTPRHHTFFEMLGNFSFGDYFKREAIAFAWEFVTSRSGSASSRTGCGSRCTTPTTRRARSGARSRACPTTASTAWATRTTSGRWATPALRAVLRDLRRSRVAAGSSGRRRSASDEFEELAEAGRFLEIWNLVFMQFDRSADGTLTPLPEPSVDTGAGLERIAAVMQGEDDNFHTDLFLPLLDAGGGAGRARRTTAAPAWRVVSRPGRPRARRELPARRRRVSRATRGAATCCAASCAARCATPGCWAGASRRSRRSRDIVIDAAGRRVSRSCATKRGTSTTYAEAEERASSRRSRADWGGSTSCSRPAPRVIPGDEAFKLYDTFGFPIDLTQIIAGERGVTVDLAGFEAALAAQRNALARRARCTATVVRVKAAGGAHAAARASGATLKRGKQEFVGYQHDEADTEHPRLPAGGSPARAAAARQSVLRRVGRAGQRHRPVQGEGWTARRRHGVARTRRAPSSAARFAERSSRRRARGGGCRAPPEHRAQPQRHAPGARGAAQAPRHARAAAGIAGRRRSACASTSRITGPSTPTALQAIESRRQRAHLAQRRRW